jgi:hypothetical protein
MSQTEDETLVTETINKYIRIHSNGIGVFNDLIRTSNTMDDLKNTLCALINTYFIETSILFQLAAVSAPAIISLTKTIQKLPNREEFNEVKSEAESQYSKVKVGLKILREALDERHGRHERGENIYG